MDKDTLVKIVKVLFLKFSSFIFLYPLAILIARELGTEGYGVYGFVTALSAMLAVFCTFGSDQMIVREIAKKEENECGMVLATAVSSTSFLSCMAILLVIVVCLFLFAFTSDVVWAYTAAATPLQVVRKVFVGIGRGYGRVVQARFSEAIVQPAVALVLVFVLELTNSLNLNFAILSIIISYAFSVIYSGYYIRDKRKKLVSKFSSKQLRLWSLASIPFLGMAFSNTLIVYADRIMLGLLHSYSEAGMYLVATRNASLLMVCFGCIQFVIGSKIVKVHRESKEKLQNMASLHVYLLVALGTFGFACLFFISDFLITLFGEEFLSSKSAFLVLIVSYFLLFLGGAPTQYLFMMGESKSALRIIVLSMVVNILLNLILIPEYGGYGASIATGVSLLVKTIFGSFTLFKKAGIHSSIFGCIWLRIIK